VVQDLRLGICIPRAQDFRHIADQMWLAAQIAMGHCNQVYGDRLNVTTEPIEEPCDVEERWHPPPDNYDAIIGPTCSRHAWQILEEWPSTWKVAISPGADLASLSFLRRDQPFFRVCGDGLKFAKDVSTLLSKTLQFQRPILAYDRTNRWWAEVAMVLSRDLRQRLSVSPMLMQFTPSNIVNDLNILRRTGSQPLPDLVVYLGNPPTGIENINELFLQGQPQRVIFPRMFQASLTDQLAASESLANERIYALDYHHPDISSGGQSHARRLKGQLKVEGSGYASHVYDTVLAAVEAYRYTLDVGRPLSDYPSVLHEMTIEGCSGTIRFDSRGDRQDQGRWDLKVWRNRRFELVHQEDFAALFERMKLHTAIRQVSEGLFKDEHYDEAIFAAFKRIEKEVEDVSGLTDKSITTLISRVFNEESPTIKLSELATPSERSEQEGFRFLFMGSMLGIRNLGAHEFPRTDPVQALEYLALASLLMRRLDRRISPP